MPGSSFAAVVVLVASTQAAAEEPIALEAFVDRVLAESLEARVDEAEVDAATARLAGAGLWPSPELDWAHESAVGTNPAQDALVLSIPLVLSRRLSHERESADIAAKAAAARRAGARGRLRHEASRVFVRQAATAVRREALTTSLDALGPLVEVIAARERAGESAGYDRVRIELERELVRAELRELEVERVSLEGEARALLAPGSAVAPFPASVPRIAIPADAAQLVSALETSLAEAKALEHEAKAARSAAEAARGKAIPDVSLRAGPLLVHEDRAGTEGGFAAGVAVSLPVFDRGQGAAAEARAREAIAEARRSALLHAARTRLAAAIESARARDEQLARHESDVLARAVELRRIAEAAYRGGAGDLLALVDAERTLRAAKLGRAALAESAALAANDVLLLAGAYDGASDRSASR